jgi:FkbM family methyltransferase
VNLRQLVKYILWRDTTQRGEFAALEKLLLKNSPQLLVDVGANDGFYSSNSFPFIARGWQAILIEPHPRVFARLQKRYQNKSNVTCLNVACSNVQGTLPMYNGSDGDAPSNSTLSDAPDLLQKRLCETILVQVKTLSGLLAEQKIPADFGLLSVDVEGMDYEVLLGLDFSRWRPRVIITENYAPKEIKKSELLVRHKYKLAARAGDNTIWQSIS